MLKTFDTSRQGRQLIYENLFSAYALCIAGFVIMLSLLFIPVTELRAAMFVCLWFLNWLAGKKNNPLITFAIILFIVLFNLVIPYGRVLFSIGSFIITQGALMAGIHRAVTLEGLIMLSRLCIRPDLKIPGSFGALIGESFWYFNLITQTKVRITGKNLMGDIDKLMIELSEASTDSAVNETPQKTKPIGFVIIVVIVILSWLPWIFI